MPWLRRDENGMADTIIRLWFRRGVVQRGGC